MDLEEFITEHEPAIIPDFVANRRFNTLMIAGIALPILLYTFLVALLLPVTIDFGWRIFLSRLIIWSIMGIMFLYANKGEMQKMVLWSEEQYNLSFYIKWIFLLYLLTIAVSIIARIPFWLGYRESNAVIIKLEQTIQRNPALLVFSAITAGVTEEFIFRGYILSRLSLLINNKHIAVITSAVLFALVHLGYKTYLELIFSFGIGIVFGYHYKKYRSLKTIIIVHFLIDIIAMSMGKHH